MRREQSYFLLLYGYEMVCGKESWRRITNKAFLLRIKVFLIEIGAVRFSCSDD